MIFYVDAKPHSVLYETER